MLMHCMHQWMRTTGARPRAIVYPETATPAAATGVSFTTTRAAPRPPSGLRPEERIERVMTRRTSDDATQPVARPSWPRRATSRTPKGSTAADLACGTRAYTGNPMNHRQGGTMVDSDACEDAGHTDMAPHGVDELVELNILTVAVAAATA